LEGSAGTLDELLPLAEREAIAQTYKKTAGFDPMVLNMSPSFSVPN